MILRYICMLTLVALAGVFSGVMWLIPNGLMGGVLGLSLAAGAIWLGSRQRRQGGDLNRGQILGAGLVSGLLGGVLMAAISHACAGRQPYDFAPPVLPIWGPLLMGIAYGLVIHWGYATRRSSSHPFWKALFSTCQGCFLLKAVATAFYITVIQRDFELSNTLFASAMISLLGAVPFALLWVLVMAWTDPAFRPGPPAAQAPCPPPEATQEAPAA
jgi:hypothetical protein